MLVTSISYVIIFFATGYRFGGFFLSNDIQLALGTIFGVIFTLRNLEPGQAYVKYGVIVAIMGGILSSVFTIIFFLVFFLFSYIFIRHNI